MGKLQEQITTGKKVNRPSDNPVVAMKGMAYRMQVDKIEQYQDNLGEVNNWLDSSDDALDKVGSALQRANELVNRAATGSLTDSDREKIQSELKQLQEQILDMANSKVGDKYLFSGTNTDKPLYDKSTTPPTFLPDTGATGVGKDIEIEVFDGVTLKVNTNGNSIFSGINDMFNRLVAPTADQSTFNTELTEIQTQLDVVLTSRADIGARQNRSDMMENRLSSQEGSAKKQMSENEDIDYEKVITDMLTEEAIHRAALSVGARIIQPSLVDFLR